MRSHQDIRRILAERILALLEISAKLPQPFRPYQYQAMSNMVDWLKDSSGTKRGYVEHATGLGKTVLFASLAAVCHGLRILIVEPSKVLVEQTIHRVAQYSGGPVGYIASVEDIRNDEGQLIGRRGYEGVNIVVTTDESLCAYAAELALRYQPDVVVFDECHWGYLSNTDAALAHFSEAVIIGFSATANYLTPVCSQSSVPLRLENQRELYGLPHRMASQYFGTLIDRRTLIWGIQNGWLAPLAWDSFETNLSLGNIVIQEGDCGLDYHMAAITNFLGGNWMAITRMVCDLYASGKYDLAKRQVFAVCPGVREAEELAAAINLLGVSSACVVGKTSGKDRRAAISAHKTKGVRLLTSVGVLREGWDGEAEVCLNLRLTISQVRYEQTLGRILRPRQNKVSLMLDANFQTFNGLQPLTASYLYGQINSGVIPGDILVNTQEGAAGVIRSPSLSPYLVSDKQQPKPKATEIKMDTDQIVLHLLFRLLCEHLVERPGDRQYIKVPITLLQNRCGQDRKTAEQFLEKMCKAGFIGGQPPWDIVWPMVKIDRTVQESRRGSNRSRRNQTVRRSLSVHHTNADYHRTLRERSFNVTGSAIVHAPQLILEDVYALGKDLVIAVLETLAASGAIEQVQDWTVVRINEVPEKPSVKRKKQKRRRKRTSPATEPRPIPDDLGVILQDLKLKFLQMFWRLVENSFEEHLRRKKTKG